MLNLHLLCGLIFWCGRVFQHSVENKAFIMKLIILNQVGMLNMCCTGEQDANTMDGCIRAFSRDEVLIVMIILLHAMAQGMTMVDLTVWKCCVWKEL